MKHFSRKQNHSSCIRYVLCLFLVCGGINSLDGQVFRGYSTNNALEFKARKEKKRQTVRGYYSDGTLQFTATYNRKGELDGTVHEYYENGFLKAEIPYKNNKRHGLARFYYNNGMLKGKIFYKRNNETGRMKFYSKDGVLVTKTKRNKRRLRSLHDDIRLSVFPEDSLE